MCPEQSPQPPLAALIVVAAGTGSRLGASVHKALVTVAGKPLVEHTLATLLAWEGLDPVVLVGHSDDRKQLTALLARLPREVHLVDGGTRRQDSVAAGLAALPEQAPAVVLVHDAARPFVPMQALPELIEAARGACALLATPVADTIKRADPDDPTRSAGTVPRHELWAAQTPQAFDRARLGQLLDQAQHEERSVTDEAALFEAACLPVRFVEGSRRNFKITTEQDLALARALLVDRSQGHTA
ncbi:MAG: 2-C-methyl-D-erythritol 4-phosphate cytidylyltransferase [Planctomycetota bacterium]|nr:MAG: 2-C-methyl-D-erythritol 4-phosphate cytidylyltransferase [Planctomycetota bacterium]